jgi:GNAT superfamily N-acetyltransferase
VNATAPARTGLIVIDLAPPGSAADWADARALIEELYAWLEDVSGVSPSTVQAGFEEELRGLPSLFSWPKGYFALAKVDGESVGTTALKLLSPEVAELKRVYVRPEARGLSLASRMLDSAIYAARSLGVHSIRLETHSEYMRPAVAMYRQRGFVEIPAYTDLQSKVPGAIAMELRL